ncbi:hypothetical protein HMPREF1982_00709 [Clostridiales bacterium oral taxon 876 str. F0540]|nr:hypothetical protein HMPREF1982_00709 [Clostridiales bacterium oral taxon 876 str. F0540]
MKETNHELVYHMLPMLVQCIDRFLTSCTNFFDPIKNTNHISEVQPMLEKSTYFMNKLESISTNIKAQSKQTNIKALEIQLANIRSNLFELYTSFAQFAIIISNNKLQAFSEVLMDELKYVEDIVLELTRLLNC